MNVTVAGLLKLIAAFIGTPLRPSQTTKLSVFVKLWLLRVRNQGQLTHDLLPHHAIDAEADAFITQVQRYMQPLEALSWRECNYLYTFLVAQGFVSFGPHEHLATAFPQASALTHQFLTALTARTKLVEQALLDESKLIAELDQIHLQYTRFFV